MIDKQFLKGFKDRTIDLLRRAADEAGFPWLEKHGDVIQCPPSAVTEGCFYVMGFNPGQKSKDSGKPILQTTEDLVADDGGHPLGDWNRGRSNLERLAVELKKPDWRSSLFVTNLFPDQSRGVSAWLREHHDRPVRQYVKAIWPLHRYYLSIVKPRCLIAYGQGARHSTTRYLWEYLIQRRNPRADWGAITTSEDPSVKCFAVPAATVSEDTGLDQLTVIGIKHLRLPRQSSYAAVSRLVG